MSSAKYGPSLEHLLMLSFDNLKSLWNYKVDIKNLCRSSSLRIENVKLVEIQNNILKFESTTSISILPYRPMVLYKIELS